MASEVNHGRLIMATRELRISSNDEEQHEEEEEEIRHIPHELINDQILGRLPIKTLHRFKCVSKFWYCTISSSKFGTTHFKLCPFSLSSSPIQCVFIKSGRSYQLFCYDDDNDEIADYFGFKGLLKLRPRFNVRERELHIVGSCNGLVCLGSVSDFFIVWNPITYQFRRIQDPFPQFSPCSWGFGYSSSDDDYKIVRMAEIPHQPRFKIFVQVYSLRSNQWRRVDDRLCNQYVFSLAMIIPSLSSNPFFLASRGVLVGETLYWMVHHNRIPGRKIISFDLALEEFGAFPYLNLMSPPGYDYDDDFLFSMGGSLCSCRVNVCENVNMTIFKSPQEQESFGLSTSVCSGSCDDAIGFTKSSKFFILDRQCKSLRLIERSSSPYGFTELMRFERSDVHIANYVPSLVSPFPDV